MDKIDPQTQARVWQRVRGEQPAGLQEQTWMATEAEVIAQLQALMKQFPGEAALLRRMQSEAQDHIACLQGIRLLQRGVKPPRPVSSVRSMDSTALVRKCYVNCLNLAMKYDAAGSDPEYGIVYAEMAGTKRRHCTQLLTLLGSGK